MEEREVSSNSNLKSYKTPPDWPEEGDVAVPMEMS